MTHLGSRLRHLSLRARRISGYGAGPLDRLRMYLWYIALPLKRRLPLLDRRIVIVRLRIAGERRQIAFSERTELVAMEEILCDGEYDVPLTHSPATIIDAGANIGASVLWFRSRYPSATIIALEPDPKTFRKLALTLAGLADVHIVEAALAAATGSANLLQAKRTWASRLVSGSTPGAVAVRTLSLADLKDACNVDSVDLLKLDIEGTEWEVLSDAVRLAQDVLVEVHGANRVSRLEELNQQTLGANLTWSGDRVAHLAR